MRSKYEICFPDYIFATIWVPGLQNFVSGPIAISSEMGDLGLLFNITEVKNTNLNWFLDDISASVGAGTVK